MPAPPALLSLRRQRNQGRQHHRPGGPEPDGHDRTRCHRQPLERPERSHRSHHGGRPWQVRARRCRRSTRAWHLQVQRYGEQRLRHQPSQQLLHADGRRRAADSGSSDSASRSERRKRGGETTVSTTPSLIGTTIPGATVQLLGAGGTIAASTTADGSGHYQVQVPGPLSVGSYSYQINVIDKFGDVSAASPAQTIHVVPPLVTVVKVSDVVKKKKVTEIIVTFSGAVNSTEAGSAKTLPSGDSRQEGIVHGQECEGPSPEIGDLCRRDTYGCAHSQEAVRTDQAGAALDQRSGDGRPARQRWQADRWQS